MKEELLRLAGPRFISCALCFILGHRWKAFYQIEVCPVEYRRCERCGWIRHACDEIDWSASVKEQNNGG
jgi:hypothetical protein